MLKCTNATWELSSDAVVDAMLFGVMTMLPTVE
jgi:hypothetical protein